MADSQFGSGVGLGIDLVGLGMQAYGGAKSAKFAGQEAYQSNLIALNEENINQQKLLQTQMEGRRANLQNLRNAQRLRAQATAAAVNQGSSAGTGTKSSGLSGGLGSITAQAAFNTSGIATGEQTAQNIFGYNQQISNEKMQINTLKSEEATAAGTSSLGGSLLQSGATIGKLAASLFAI